MVLAWTKRSDSEYALGNFAVITGDEHGPPWTVAIEGIYYGLFRTLAQARAAIEHEARARRRRLSPLSWHVVDRRIADLVLRLCRDGS